MKTLKYTLLVLASTATMATFADTTFEDIANLLTGKTQTVTPAADSSSNSLAVLAGNIESAKELWETAKSKAALFTEQAKDLYAKYTAARDLFKRVAGDKATEIETQIAEIKKAPADVQANYKAELDALKAKYENIKQDTKDTIGSTDWAVMWEKGKELFQNNGGLLEGLFGANTK